MVSTYATRLYFTTQKEDGILVVCVYTRGQVAAGTGPLITTYIDLTNEKWISRIGEKWSEAYLSTMIWNMRCDANLKNTDWGVAKDVFAAEDLALCNEELVTDAGAVTEAVGEWQEDVRGKENRRKLQKRIDKWEGHMALIPPLPEGFEEWADKDGAGQSNFLFYRKKGKNARTAERHGRQTRRWYTQQESRGIAVIIPKSTSACAAASICPPKRGGNRSTSARTTILFLRRRRANTSPFENFM